MEKNIFIHDFSQTDSYISVNSNKISDVKMPKGSEEILRLKEEGQSGEGKSFSFVLEGEVKERVRKGVKAC